MARWFVAGIAIVVAATVGCPVDDGRMLINATDCYLCHAEDYASATNPPHVGVNPTTCWECHDTDAWRPARGGGHPEADFAIATGHHSGIGCADCHDSARGSYTNGQNTDCIGCHLEVHLFADMSALHRERGVADFPALPETPNFCLSCHPDGNAPGSSHPEDRFPIGEGHHSGIVCSACHDATRGSSGGGANTDCTHCHLGAHPRSQTDPMHAGVSGYPAGDAPPNFCLTCHPRGQADARPHPESVFPIASGHHEEFACNDCHDQGISPINSRENTDCIGCHTGEHADEQNNDDHQEGSTGTRFRALLATGSPHFCLECHPHGQAED